MKTLEQKYLNKKSSKANKEVYEKSTISKRNLVIPEQKIINNVPSEIKNKEIKMKEVINRNVDTLKNLLHNKE